MSNPRIEILLRDVERDALEPMRRRGWAAKVVATHDAHSSIEIVAKRDERPVRFAVVYSTATANAHYLDLASRCEIVFYHGSRYKLESYSTGVTVPIEPLGNFFPFLVSLNREIEPAHISGHPPVQRPRTRTITDERPDRAVLLRLEQYKSKQLSRRLIEMRCEERSVSLSSELLDRKATGLAFTVGNALEYFRGSVDEPINKRILGLYYGTLAFAFSELIASPNGPTDLDELEGATVRGHGLYLLPSSEKRFPDFTVGALATGFFPYWISAIGYDTSLFPKAKAKNVGDFERLDPSTFCSLGQLLSSFPEIEDLFAGAIGIEHSWVVASYGTFVNGNPSLNATEKAVSSAYCKFTDTSGQISKERIGAR